jgi:hypothetical protein
MANHGMMKRNRNISFIRLFLLLILVSVSGKTLSQNLRFGVHFDPLITWMSTNSAEYNNEGVRAGFSLGLNVLKYFDDNYAFSTGIGFINAGGKISCTEAHPMVFNNSSPFVPAGDVVVYHLRYLNIPIGFHLNTNQIGYVTLFTDLGIDARVLLRSSVDIPQQQYFDEIAKNEVYGMNLGWHINAGVEYSLGGSTALVAGLGFDEDFFDITKDLSDVEQPVDRSGLKIIRIKLGVIF